MSRFARIRRRPDHWASPHERARVRAAERMDGPLGLAESTWLDDHLAGCPACTAIAAQYERDRASLRTLRDPAPVPPRDLWARTSAAIERESAARGGRRAAGAGGRTRPAWPLGALSGIAVIVVVIGLSAVSSGMLVLGTPSHGVGGDDGSAAVAGSSPTDDTTAVAAATPILVGAGDVAYVAGGGGQLAYSQVGVDEVCAATDTSECGTLADAGPSRIAISNAPKAIISSPTNPNTAIVVDRDAAGNDRIRIVVLPSPSPDTTLASASPAPTVAPSSPPASPSPTVAAHRRPVAAVRGRGSPPASASASTEPSVEPSGSVPASEAPTASADAPVSIPDRRAVGGAHADPGRHSRHHHEPDAHHPGGPADRERPRGPRRERRLQPRRCTGSRSRRGPPSTRRARTSGSGRSASRRPAS